jgi:hypothetical protein
MKVGICYTKRSPNGMSFADAFAEGVTRTGDKIEKIQTVQDCNKLYDCDVSFQVAEATPLGTAPEDPVRRAIKKIQGKQNKRRLIMDTRLITTETPHYSIGVDGIKGSADFFNKNSDSDRRKKRNINIQDWQTDGDHILIIGQVYNSFGLSHIGRDLAKKYFVDLCKRIRLYTDRRILYRFHPNNNDVNLINQLRQFRHRGNRLENIEFICGTREGKRPLSIDLKNAKCTITRTSAGCIDGLIQGIPCITEDSSNIAYPVCEYALANIESPRMPSRDQWVNNICYSEWSKEEFREGLPWKHFKNRICNYNELTQTRQSVGKHPAPIQ